MKNYKPIIIFLLFLGGYSLVAMQVELFNATDKKAFFAFKFFHKKAQQKMVISDFNLGPKEKTCFPKQEDLIRAQPLKVEVYWSGDPSSVVSKKFNREETGIQSLQLVKQKGKLKLETVTKP